MVPPFQNEPENRRFKCDDCQTVKDRSQYSRQQLARFSELFNETFSLASNRNPRVPIKCLLCAKRDDERQQNLSRQCIDCQKVKPLTDKYWPKRARSNKQDPLCWICWKARQNDDDSSEAEIDSLELRPLESDSDGDSPTRPLELQTITPPDSEQHFKPNGPSSPALSASAKVFKPSSFPSSAALPPPTHEASTTPTTKPFDHDAAAAAFRAGIVDEMRRGLQSAAPCGPAGLVMGLSAQPAGLPGFGIPNSYADVMPGMKRRGHFSLSLGYGPLAQSMSGWHGEAGTTDLAYGAGGLAAFRGARSSATHLSFSGIGGRVPMAPPKMAFSNSEDQTLLFSTARNGALAQTPTDDDWYRGTAGQGGVDIEATIHAADQMSISEKSSRAEHDPVHGFYVVPVLGRRINENGSSRNSPRRQTPHPSPNPDTDDNDSVGTWSNPARKRGTKGAHARPNAAGRARAREKWEKSRSDVQEDGHARGPASDGGRSGSVEGA